MRKSLLLAQAACCLLATTGALAQAVTLSAPASGLRWGLDAPTVSLGCSGSQYFPTGPGGGSIVGVSDENNTGIGIYSLSGFVPCVGPAEISYRLLLPGAHTLAAKRCTFSLYVPGGSVSCDPPSAPLATRVYMDGMPIPALAAKVTVASVYAAGHHCQGSARYVEAATVPFSPPPGMASPQYIEVTSPWQCVVTVGLELPFTPSNGDVWVYDKYANPASYGWRPITTADPEVAFQGSLAVLPVTPTGWIAFSHPIPPPVSVAPVTPKSGLWWAGQSESGWGLHVSAANDRLFVAGYIYDYGGKATWAVMPSGTWDATHTTWTGDLYVPHGAPFSSYDASRYSPGTAAGKGQLAFSGDGTASFSYLAGPNRSISYFDFASSATGDAPYQGLWWGGATQNGWGLSIAQQGETLFATWFTYDADGNPAWYYMPGATRLGTGHYAGALYRTTGGPWPMQVPYDGAQTKVIAVGTLDLAFSGNDAGTMKASVDGKAVTVPIQRFAF